MLAVGRPLENPNPEAPTKPETQKTFSQIKAPWSRDHNAKPQSLTIFSAPGMGADALEGPRIRPRDPSG